MDDTCRLLYAKMEIQHPSQELLHAIDYHFKYNFEFYSVILWLGFLDQNYVIGYNIIDVITII